VLGLLAEAVSGDGVGALLRGAPIEPVFRKVSNFNTKPLSK
jgi:glutamate-1-semialdehyde 2,1-aminomutase